MILWMYWKCYWCCCCCCRQLFIAYAIKQKKKKNIEKCINKRNKPRKCSAKKWIKTTHKIPWNRCVYLQHIFILFRRLYKEWMQFFLCKWLFSHLMIAVGFFPHLQMKRCNHTFSQFPHGSLCEIDVFGMILTRPKCAIEQINNNIQFSNVKCAIIHKECGGETISMKIEGAHMQSTSCSSNRTL